MTASIVEFFVLWPHLAWWREIPDMPYEVWDQLRRIAEMKMQQRG